MTRVPVYACSRCGHGWLAIMPSWSMAECCPMCSEPGGDAYPGELEGFVELLTTPSPDELDELEAEVDQLLQEAEENTRIGENHEPNAGENQSIPGGP